MDKKKFIGKIGIIEMPQYINSNVPTIEDIEWRGNMFKFIVPFDMWIDRNNMVLNHPRQQILCYCEKFKQIKEGEVVPHYELTFTRHSDETTTLDSATEIKR